MASPEKINIPQKSPMVMIDRIRSSGSREVVTSLFIREDNVFCHKGIFTEAGLVENMAQTAAAASGLKKGITGEKPPLGFIGGIRNLVIREYPHAGNEITTSIEVEHEVFDASVVRATITLGGKVIASCTLKIFLIG